MVEPRMKTWSTWSPPGGWSIKNLDLTSRSTPKNLWPWWREVGGTSESESFSGSISISESEKQGKLRSSKSRVKTVSFHSWFTQWSWDLHSHTFQCNPEQKSSITPHRSCAPKTVPQMTKLGVRVREREGESESEVYFIFNARALITSIWNNRALVLIEQQQGENGNANHTHCSTEV